MARFQKGQSGNPAGRPKGSSNHRKLREQIGKQIPEIIAATVERALTGDPAASKLLLDRVLPALRPQDPAVRLDLGKGLSADTDAVLVALGAGKITPAQGGQLLNGLGVAARIQEVDDLVRRVEALEESQNAKP